MALEIYLASVMGFWLSRLELTKKRIFKQDIRANMGFSSTHTHTVTTTQKVSDKTRLTNNTSPDWGTSSFLKHAPQLSTPLRGNWNRNR